MIYLAQTLSGDWVLTMDNPEEDGWQTELARFETGTATAPNSRARAALETVAAHAAVVLAFGERIRVESNASEAIDAMRERIQDYGGRVA